MNVPTATCKLFQVVWIDCSAFRNSKRDDVGFCLLPATLYAVRKTEDDKSGSSEEPASLILDQH